MSQITIGLAGHIDHGKTSIVKALTGKNTDNLKEEIKRGMTIDIGFAHLNKSISLIDVPGHERFIKNMVSGVSAIDFAVIVIAAEDGIMPQTIEHIEILQLLGVKSGVIVINKIDLVESDWLELVEDEIKEFLKETFLENSKIFKVSAINGDGIKELENEIKNINETHLSKFNRGVFRMFVDRVFSIKGFGTVVTGTVSSGNAHIGEKLQLLPNLQDVKIRGLQSHDQNVKEIKMGNRAAINLQSFDRINIKRGHQISTKDFFSLTEIIVVKFQTLVKSEAKIKNNIRIRFHLGTQETIGRIFLPNLNSNIAIIKFEKVIVVSYKDRFILRSYSPITTIGGGEVLDINVYGKWNDIKKYAIKFLQAKKDNQIIKTILERDIVNIYNIKTLSEKLGLLPVLLEKYLNQLDGIIYLSENRWMVTLNQLIQIEKRILDFINNKHIKNKFKAGYLKEELNKLFNYEIDLLDKILLRLVERKVLKVNNDLYDDINYSIKLSKDEISAKKMILEILNNKKFNTPSINEISNEINIDKNIIDKILKLESNNNNIIILNENIVFSKIHLDDLIIKIKKYFEKNDILTIKEFKLITKTSRKYAVPILEYLDKKKITYRLGNDRKINR